MQFWYTHAIYTCIIVILALLSSHEGHEQTSTIIMKLNMNQTNFERGRSILRSVFRSGTLHGTLHTLFHTNILLQFLCSAGEHRREQGESTRRVHNEIWRMMNTCFTICFDRLFQCGQFILRVEDTEYQVITAGEDQVRSEDKAQVIRIKLPRHVPS